MHEQVNVLIFSIHVKKEAVLRKKEKFKFDHFFCLLLSSLVFIFSSPRNMLINNICMPLAPVFSTRVFFNTNFRSFLPQYMLEHVSG
jgi:hypothetical protein